jgi:hypothetical protein
LPGHAEIGIIFSLESGASERPGGTASGLRAMIGNKGGLATTASPTPAAQLSAGRNVATGAGLQRSTAPMSWGKSDLISSPIVDSGGRKSWDRSGRASWTPPGRRHSGLALCSFSRAKPRRIVNSLGLPSSAGGRRRQGRPTSGRAIKTVRGCLREAARRLCAPNSLCRHLDLEDGYEGQAEAAVECVRGNGSPDLPLTCGFFHGVQNRAWGVPGHPSY